MESVSLQKLSALVSCIMVKTTRAATLKLRHRQIYKLNDSLFIVIFEKAAIEFF